MMIMAFKECLIAVIVLTVIGRIEAGISVHKIKGRCTPKLYGKPSTNDVTKSLSELEKDQCMKCFCDKGGSSMTCFGCSPSYITIDEQMALLDKRCYLSKADELPQYPTCCRNTIVCEEGINSKYFTQKRFDEFQADMQPFVEMYTFLQFLKSAREPMVADHQPDDMDYFAPHAKDTEEGELMESPLLEKVDDAQFVLPAQQQKTVDTSMFLGQSQMQHEAPVIDFIKPSQYQTNMEMPSIKELSKPSFGKVEEPAAPPKRKPVKSLRKIYRKPAAVVLEENEDHESYDDIKAARKERRQSKFLRKIHKTRAGKVALANIKQKADDNDVVKTHKPRKIGFAPIIHFKDDVLANHGSAKTKDVEPTRTVSAKSPKFAHIPSDMFEDDVEHVKQPKVPGLAPIPDFELDEPELPLLKGVTRKQPAPSAKFAPLPDYDFGEFAKEDKEAHSKQHSVAKPEVGASLLMDMQYLQIPEKPEDFVRS